MSVLLSERLGADRQVLALAVARAAESVGNSFLIVVLPLFVASDAVGGSTFGLTEVALTGVVLSLFGFVNSPLQPFTGRFSDRIGRRKILVLFGLVVLAVASFSYSLATEYWQLVVLRIVQGVAGAFIIPTTIALVNDLAAEDNRGGNMGTYNTFRLVGFGAGPVAAGGVVAAGPYSLAVGPLALSLTGFEAAFTLAGGTAVLSSLLVFFTVREPDIEAVDPESDSTGIQILEQGGERLLDPVFTLGVVAFFMAVCIALFATLGDPVNNRLDQGAQMFGLQFAAFILAQVLIQAPVGRATDFYGRKPFIIAGTALLIPTTFVQGLVLDSWLMFLARFAQGIAGAMVFAPGLALAGDLAAESGSGTTLSVLTMAFSLGVAVGPLLSGFLVVYGFHVPFTFGAFLATVGLVLVQTQVNEVLSVADGDPVTSSDPGD